MDRSPVIEGYRWLIWDPEMDGGSAVVKGTKLSASTILASLSESPNGDTFLKRFPDFPAEALPEVLRYASVQLSKRRADSDQ